MRHFGKVAVLAATLVIAGGVHAQANPASEALRTKASDQLYNLDGEQALLTLRQAIAADPHDGAAQRALAGAILARIAMMRGTMTVDSYLGRASSKEVPMPPPPPELAKEFHSTIDRAIALAREQVAARPNDAQAQYEYGAAVGIRASYMATIDGGIMAAFRAAREAYNAHERVLELAPSRADAGLIVGTYRYLVSALSMPMRWVAYISGFGGGRDRGLRMVEAASAYSGDNRADAHLALLLLYTREGRLDDALRKLDWLRERYPRNRLFWLETGSALIRAQRFAQAERMLNEGMAMLAADTRTRMFGEEALWYYRLGSARASLGRTAEAQADLKRAIAANGRMWVQGRAHLELGKLALAASDPAAAREHLEAASRLGDSDRDASSAAHARELLNQAVQTR